MNKPVSAVRRRNERDASNPLADPPATESIVTENIPDPVDPQARVPTHDEIARRAYQLFEERGREPGHEWEDWFRAERELL